MLFSLQRLCMQFEDFGYIKENLDVVKYNFCIEFEKELDIKGKFSEDVFDFLYNIYDYKRVFRNNDFKKLRSDFFDLDFTKFVEVGQFINSVYTEIAFLSRDYFYEVFNLKGNTSKELAEHFGSNLQINYEKFVNNF